VPAEVARVQAATDMATPRPFEARLSMVFRFKPHWWWFSSKLETLGHANINPATGDYSLVCVSPDGYKMFDVGRTNGETNARMTASVAGNPQEVGEIIGQDFSSLYFELVPPPGAVVTQKGGHLVFRSSTGNDWSEYEYDIISTRLVGKNTFTNGTLRRISFDDYQRYEFGTYPLAMDLVNSRSRYSLEVRTMSIRLPK
jgi:hypothetical protein